MSVFLFRDYVVAFGRFLLELKIFTCHSFCCIRGKDKRQGARGATDKKGEKLVVARRASRKGAYLDLCKRKANWKAKTYGLLFDSFPMPCGFPMWVQLRMAFTVVYPLVFMGARLGTTILYITLQLTKWVCLCVCVAVIFMHIYKASKNLGPVFEFSL